MGKPERTMGQVLVVAVFLAVALLGTVAMAEGRPAAKRGTAPRMNAYFASGFDDAAYQKEAVAKVLKGWVVRSPLPASGKKAVVISKIRRDGKVVELYFNLKTGNEAFDLAAESAVQKASPFPPIPKSYRNGTLEVHWHFEVGGP